MSKIVHVPGVHVVPANQPHGRQAMVPYGQQPISVEVAGAYPTAPAYPPGYPPEAFAPVYTAQPVQYEQYGQSTHSHYPIQPVQGYCTMPAHLQPQIPAHILAMLGQQADFNAARGISQQQHYAYHDPTTGSDVQGSVTTQAYIVPIESQPTGYLSAAQSQPQLSQPQSQVERRSGPTWQQVGLMGMFAGLALIILMLAFGLTSSQSYNSGMERANTTIRQYP